MNHTILLILTLAVLSGCGSTETKNSTGDPNEITGLSPECTQFLDGYEKYVDDYIQVLEDYKSNPTDLSLLERTTAMATEAQAWSGKATSECKDVTEFISRLTKIQAKLSAAAIGS